MSETMYESPELNVTNFDGGTERGRCVLFTLKGEAKEQGYVELTHKNLRRIFYAVVAGIPVPDAKNWRNSLNPDDLEHLKQAECGSYPEFVLMWNGEKTTAEMATRTMGEKHYPCLGCSIIARKLGLEEDS